LSASHSHDQEDERGDEKTHRRNDLRGRGDDGQNRYPGEERHPCGPAPNQGRGAEVDERHDPDEGRERGDETGVDLKVEGGQGRHRDAERGRPPVRQGARPATAGGPMGVRRVVGAKVGVSFDLVLSVLIFSSILVSLFGCIRVLDAPSRFSLPHRQDEDGDRAKDVEDKTPLRERSRHHLVGPEVGEVPCGVPEPAGRHHPTSQFRVRRHRR
jgi:hypothetical protein